jgi:hypothetical protein
MAEEKCKHCDNEAMYGHYVCRACYERFYQEKTEALEKAYDAKFGDDQPLSRAHHLWCVANGETC